MKDVAVQFYSRYSFFTRSLFLGWDKENQAIWGKLLKYSDTRWPAWSNWDETREKLIRPLCELASSVVLFGNEWIGDDPVVLATKDIVDTNFCTEGKNLVCHEPLRLIGASLFWTGGSPVCFNLMQVLTFKDEHLKDVLNILQYHQQAGEMSSRSGGEWTRIRNFSKATVKNGGFAVLVYAHEAEMFYPLAQKAEVEQYGNRVSTRWNNVMAAVKSRSQLVSQPNG